MDNIKYKVKHNPRNPHLDNFDDNELMQYQSLTVDAITGLAAGKLDRLINLLESDFSIEAVRPFLLELLRDPNEFGQSLKFEKNDIYKGNENAPIDDFAQRLSLHGRFETFRSARYQGLSYDDAIRHAADVHCVGRDAILAALRVGKTGVFGTYPSREELKKARARITGES